MNRHYAVTVGKNGQTGLTAQAKQWAEELDLPFFDRVGGTLRELIMDKRLDGLIVATAHGPRAYTPDGSLFFHPGMSILRIKNLNNGQGDRMARAMKLEAGMSVLDCTLGLAADACVASFVTGEKGKVVGLEASLPVAFVVRSGLKNYRAGDEVFSAACRRVEVVYCRTEDYLAQLPPKSFDVVYFDPMFGSAVKRSSGMRPLRPLAFAGAPDAGLLLQAKRAARQRLVIKSDKYAVLPYPDKWREAAGGKYSRVKYSVIEVDA